MDKRQKLTGVQRIVAKQMVKSTTEIPHVTTIREVPMDSVFDTRESIAGRYEHLSVLAFVLHAVVRTLPEFPMLNASLEEDEIVYHDDINLGVAVAVGQDLKVPVMPSAKEKSFDAMVAKVSELRQKARENDFKPSDFRGGTFTVSNSGALGGEIFTPIINHPQSGILGLGRVKEKPVVKEDSQIASCPMMYLCLSYDHRIVNGSQAVLFLGELERLLTDADALIEM